MTGRMIVSPLVVFLCLLAAFEFCARLPFVLYVLSAPETGIAIHTHFFSFQSPDEVIVLGLTITTMALVAGLFAAFISSPSVPQAWGPDDFPRIPATLYPVGLLFVGAAFVAIASLGVSALLADISGKRSELGDYGLTWLLLKLGNFCHLIAALFFVRMQQTGSVLDRIAFGVTVLALLVSTIVFSQRAILISFLLEIVYLQLLLGTFQMRRLGSIALMVLLAGILISALRPGSASMSVGELLLFGVEKLLQSRYFLDFTKLGTTALWADGEPWMGPVIIGFVLEPFLGDQVIFYKEIGQIIARETYLYSASTGVTPGALLEGVLSFGIAGGILTFGLIFFVFLRVERALFAGGPHSLWTTMVLLLILSKFSLLLNSSLGAFAFQFLLEFMMLLLAFTLMSLLGSVSATSSSPKSSSATSSTRTHPYGPRRTSYGRTAASGAASGTGLIRD